MLKDIEQAEKAIPPASSTAQGSTGEAQSEKSPTSEPEFDMQDVQAGELTLELKRIFQDVEANGVGVNTDDGLMAISEALLRSGTVHKRSKCG